MDPITLAFGAVFVIGVLLELVGSVLLVKRIASARRMQVADAVVVANELYRSPRGVLDHDLHRPTVRFKTARGQEVEYTPTHYSNLFNHPVGTQIRVQYEPEHPDRVVLATASAARYWIPAIVCFGVGTVLMVAAVIMSVAFGDLFGLL